MAWTYDNQDWARVNNGQIELKNADGTWSAAGTPEHAESMSYVQNAANSSEVDKLIAYARSGGTLNAEQSSFLANPLLGMDSYGQGSRWGELNLFDNQFSPQQAGALMQYGVPAQLSAADRAAGNQFNFDQSPAQQSARDDSGGFFGGDIGKLAMLAAAIYSGGSAAGLWGGLGEGAALAAGDAMAGLIPAGELGAWTGAAGAAASTAGGNMFELGDLTDAWSNAFGEGGGWNPLTDGYGMGDAASTAAGYGQSMATAAELAQMQAQYPDWYNALTGVTDVGISPSNIWSAFKAATGSGSGGGTDWIKTLGSLGAAGLGAYASNKQTSALEQQAQRYEGYGAPYRQKLSDLYKDPTSFLSSPEVRVPVDQGTSSLMRSLSTQGNPFGSGNALQQGQSYASDQLFGKLGQEKDRLAGFGGLSSYNQAAPQASTNAINSSSNAWNAVGAGANNIFNPPQTQAQTMAEWAKAMRGGV